MCTHHICLLPFKRTWLPAPSCVFESLLSVLCGLIPRRETAESHGNSTFNFLKNHHTVFHSGLPPYPHTEVKMTFWNVVNYITSLVNQPHSMAPIPVREKPKTSQRPASAPPITDSLLFSPSTVPRMLLQTLNICMCAKSLQSYPTSQPSGP